MWSERYSVLWPRQLVRQRFAGLVVVLAAAVVIPSCSQPQSDGVENSIGSPVSLPESHPAAELLNQGARYPEFSAAAQSVGSGIVCSRAAWALCLVRANGVLAVVPLGAEVGTVASVDGDGWAEPVLVPMDGDVVALASGDEEIRVVLELGGATVGSMQGLDGETGG